MRKIIVAVVLSMSFICLLSMEDPSEKKTLYDGLPKDLCALIQGRLSKPSFAAKNHRRLGGNEYCCMSLTWNNIAMTEEDLFDPQLWWIKEYRVKSRFRFDNDGTTDQNSIQCCGLDNAKLLTTKFDGPNHDGGEHRGVSVIGYTSESEGKLQTILALFKLHSELEPYKGLQPKEEVEYFKHPRFMYDDFPYVSEPFENEKLDYCAIARRALCALATTHVPSNTQILRIFSYAAKTFLDGVPDQEFDVKRQATIYGVPLFTKLCWLYGRNLLGVSSENKLYIIAVEDGKFECHLQKIPIAVKNIALNNPKNQHEVILCDTDDALYYAHLGKRSANGAFNYRCIYRNGANLENMVLAEKQERPMIPWPIDRVWAFRDKLGLMNLNTQECVFIEPLINHAQNIQWTLDAINSWARDVRKKKEILP